MVEGLGDDDGVGDGMGGDDGAAVGVGRGAGVVVGLGDDDRTGAGVGGREGPPDGLRDGVELGERVGLGSLADGTKAEGDDEGDVGIEPDGALLADDRADPVGEGTTAMCGGGSSDVARTPSTAVATAPATIAAASAIPY